MVLESTQNPATRSYVDKSLAKIVKIGDGPVPSKGDTLMHPLLNSNIHIYTRVIEVADFKSEVKIDLLLLLHARL